MNNFMLKRSASIALMATLFVSAAASPALAFESGYGGGGGGGGSSGGSGWIDPRCYIPVKPPFGGFKFYGNPGHDVFSRNVQLGIDGGDADFMMISDKPDFDGATMEPYSKAKAWQLTQDYGAKWLYARFFNHCKIPTNVFSWNFNYRQPGRVLGEVVYADGTLLRGSDNRVYVVKGNSLVYIPSLTELLKYVGKEIKKVDDSVIAEFGNINNPSQGQVLGEQVIGNGTLVRGSNMKVYVVVNGKKVHIRSLDELSKKYLGKAIMDVSDEVLAQY